VFPTKFQLIWPNGFREDFFNWPITNKNYNKYSFRLDPLTSMTAIDNSCFWLVNLWKFFSSATTQPVQNFLGCHRQFLFVIQELKLRIKMWKVNRQRTPNDSKKLSPSPWWYGWLDLNLLMQSSPIITKVVHLIPAYIKVCSIQHYMIKFVSDLWQLGGFLWIYCKKWC
jgi:hypothetical protein